MKKLLILTISIALCSCSTAPKDAAQQVCDCNKEALKAITDDLSKANEQRKKCSEMADGFKKSYNKEELETYNKAITECAIGSVLDAIK
jgi:starvation-inducible outer membrane lipoprotein